jgi:hypothetical protein
MERRIGLSLVVIAAWLWALGLLVAASDGLINLLESILLLAAGVFFGFLWVCTAATCWGKSRFSERWVCMSVPPIWIVVGLLATTNLPLMARLWMSEAAFKESAESYISEPPRIEYGGRRIGFFNVDKVWCHGRTIAFATEGQPFITSGVICAPEGIPSAPLPMEVEELLWARYTHLYGPWYRFELGD